MNDMDASLVFFDREAWQIAQELFSVTPLREDFIG